MNDRAKSYVAYFKIRTLAARGCIGVRASVILVHKRPKSKTLESVLGEAGFDVGKE